MSAKARTGFGLAAALPLLAPYELLVKPDWSGASGFAFLFGLVVSLGAVLVSVLMLFVAIFGINRRVEFDPATKTVHVTESHLMQRERRFACPFAEIVKLELGAHDWSDGPSTYDIHLTPGAGKPFAFGDFSSRTSAENALAALRAIVGKPA